MNDIELISFHKGFVEIIKIWKKINKFTGNKLGIIRDYDDQEKAKVNHNQYSDEKNICIRTTSEYTLEPEIIKTGDNYKILKDKYGDVFGWKDMSVEDMDKAWRNAKASEMLTICKDIQNGELSGFKMPKHIEEVFDFLNSRGN